VVVWSRWINVSKGATLVYLSNRVSSEKHKSFESTLRRVVISWFRALKTMDQSLSDSCQMLLHSYVQILAFSCQQRANNSSPL
jgi:hypothetical protein